MGEFTSQKLANRHIGVFSLLSKTLVLETSPAQHRKEPWYIGDWMARWEREAWRLSTKEKDPWERPFRTKLIKWKIFSWKSFWSEWVQDAQSIRTHFQDDLGTLSQTSMLMGSSDCCWRLVTWEDWALCGHCCKPEPTQSLTRSRCFMNIHWKKESCLGLLVVLFPYKMSLWSLTKAWAETMAVGMKEGDECESNLESKIKQTGVRWWVS